MLKRIFGGLSRHQPAPAPAITPTITIVSGLPRSGTSLMMRMLEAGGIPPVTDHERSADEDNPGGYYEFERVKQMEKGDIAWLADAAGKAVKVISLLLRSLPDGYHYNVIFMERDLGEVLASQRKMLENRAEAADAVNDEQMQALFTKHLTDIRQWLAAQPNFAVLYVNYSDLLTNPEPQVEKLVAFFEGTLDGAAMIEVIDPTLYRNRG
ncbi:MAG: sulfotransferase [Caldilineaceae bacterium]|nr:sulfotransferase [Caldilineaceae bacterium]